MVTLSCTLFFLLLVVHGSIQKSSPASLKYRAAVVEYNSVFYRNDSPKTLNDNAEKIVGYIQKAAEKEVDIIVFPELSLSSFAVVEESRLLSQSTLIPDPSQNYTPCTNSSITAIQALIKIACAAERNGIYVVVNILEKEECSGEDCTTDGAFLYMTSVAFDRKGRIIARYRKHHVLVESGLLDPMEKSEISTFNTDFGVTFGNIMGFDIINDEPWLTLTRKLNITDIIFTSGRFFEMPFLTAIQIEAGWAYAEDVNMLASGHKKIECGNSGSGIYAGRQGVVTATLPLNDHEEMLVADVWKKPKKIMTSPMLDHKHQNHPKLENKERDDHPQEEFNQGRAFHNFQWKYEKLDAFKTKVITQNGLTLQKLSNSGINCRFQVNVTNLSPPLTYRLLAFDGVRGFDNAIVLGTRACAIVQCANDSIDSCGRIQNSSATFNFITIAAMYVDSPRLVMIPSTLGSDMLPLVKWTWKEYKHKENISTSISLTAPTQNLVTFGIWGRNFEKDQTARHTYSVNKASASKIFNQILCLPLLLVLFEK